MKNNFIIAERSYGIFCFIHKTMLERYTCSSAFGYGACSGTKINKSQGTLKN
jgi:hypothetical protein